MLANMDALFETNHLTLPNVPYIGVKEAFHELQSSLPLAAWDSATLEGYNFTYPEVQTILSGYSVGGSRISDVEEVRGIGNGWFKVLEAIENDADIDKKLICDINRELSGSFNIDPGVFRTDSTVHGGGTVRTPEGTYHAPQEELDELWAKFHVDDPVERALLRFPFMALAQFFFDGNKRTAMMTLNVDLVSRGYSPITVPGERAHEWNVGLTELFMRRDVQPIIDLLGESVLVYR